MHLFFPFPARRMAFGWLLVLIFSCLLVPTGRAQSTGTISGTLLDGATGEPLPFANVVLLRPADSTLVKGMPTTLEGTFSFADVAFGTYILRVTQLGYRPARRPVTLSAAQPALALGRLRLRSATQQLREVTIVAEKPLIQDNLDKRVINVDKDLSTIGGTAVDVLQNVPSVNVDQDGAVSLRGSSNVTIYIDGKPTGAAGGRGSINLEQIPASQIESIEVVTNPSARYDAEGNGGILNIVLKKERRDGLNGTATANIGTRNKYNGSLALNYRKGKLNAFFNYDGRYDERFSRRDINQQTTLAGTRGDSLIRLRQTGRGDRFQSTHTARLGFDYDLTPTQTITLSARPRLTNRTSDELLNAVRTFGPTGEDRGSFVRDIYNKDRDYSVDYSVDYRRTWEGQKSRELTANAIFSPIVETDTTDSRQRYTDQVPAGLSPLLRQRQGSQDKLYQGSAQVDYVHPLSETSRVDGGLKTTLRRTNSNFTFLEATADEAPLVADFTRSNQFQYQEYVQAAYVNFQDARGKLSYQAGLRGEQTNTHGEQGNTFGLQPEEIEFRRSYFGLFPSATVAFDPTPSQRVQLSYSRRINRPDVGQLNPAIDRSDPLNYRQGNPRLLPEYSNAFELGYQWFKDRTSITPTAFYRQTNGVVQRVRTLDAATGITYQRPQNISRREAYGLELSVVHPITTWWRLTANGSAYRNVISGVTGTELDNRNFAYTGRVNSTFSPVKGLDIQVSGYYRSRNVTAQGSFGAVYATELGARYSVLKDRGAISLRLSDVFDTREYNIRFEGPNFVSDNTFKRESRIGFIGFTYRFGRTATNRRNRDEDNNDQRPQPDDNLGGGDFGN